MGFLIMIASAVFFYRVAEIEGRKGFFWAGMSILVFFAGEAMFGFRMSFLHVIGLQLLLFGVMWGLNFLPSRKKY